MKFFYTLFFSLCLTAYSSHAQYPPQVGYEGTTAIHKDSNIFVNWATSCTIERGYQNISNTSLGYASVGEPSAATGNIGNGLVSLGDGGSAILEFEHPIYNGEGADFAVFENGFLQNIGSDMAFLELAFVEVSSDGINFHRFSAISNVSRNTQLDGFAMMDARLIHNFAGKYIANYGTPFDLDDLKDIDGLDINHITHIKITDVVGSIDPVYATYDSNGEIINDPFPTPFPSGGFDLSGIGVIHQKIATRTKTRAAENISFYPNPTKDYIRFDISNFDETVNIDIFHLSGQLISKQTLSNGQLLDVSVLNPGAYIGILRNQDLHQHFKFVKE